MGFRDSLDGPTLLFGASAALAVTAFLEFSNKRKKILRIASGELGETAWEKYLAAADGVPGYPIAWCGVFALWVLHQAGLGESIRWKFDGRGFLSRLPQTQDPKPGDLGYLSSKQHHAIIESVDGDNVFTIDGNSYGRRVARNLRKRSDFQAFYSIQPLIDGEVA